MGTHKIEAELEGEERRQFMRWLLADLRALEEMLVRGCMETGIRRIGAEQEMFLLDRSWHPAPAAMKVIERLGDDHFTTELGLFNLEFNTDPVVFTGDCLHRLETQLTELMGRAREAAQALEVELALVGILPSVRKSDLGMENMTPRPRYQAINRALSALRGGAYQFHIKGVDELLVQHDSVMVEACNASFQVHFQVGPEEFPNLYNLAQVVTAPLLAAATNSPLLFGKRLWAETRIALFQQSVDTRSAMHHLRESSPRVNFGTRWVRKSVLEIYREDVARFRTLVSTELDEDPFEKLARGEPPALKALRLHNGTVYRWNRPCYGITEGRPHLRIENRVMPSGPTILDEIANATLWYGMMSALSDQYEDITEVIDFEHAQLNFVAAARQGLTAHFHWLEGEEIVAPKLLVDRLIPAARDALVRRGIDTANVDRYLGVVERRVTSGKTGSRWLLQSLAGMKEQGTGAERMNALTAAVVSRQKTAHPVHEWDPARLEEGGGWKYNYAKVEQYMTTDLFTVREDDPMDLVANLMEWEKIRHIPVEDREHRLVGLVSYRSVLRLLTRGKFDKDAVSVAVSEIMRRDVITVSPDTPTLEAVGLMRAHDVGCLPVVQNGRLIGIVTERDFMDIAAELLEQKLNE